MGGSGSGRRPATYEHPKAPVIAPEELFLPDDNVSKLLVEQAGGSEDAEVKVYKCGGPQPGQRPGQGTIRDAWLYKCTPNEFDEEQLQQSYGAGRYRIKMYGTNGDGVYGTILNKVLEIGAPPGFRPNLLPAAASGNVTVNTPGSGGSDIAKAIAETLAPVLQAQAMMMQKITEHLSGSKTEWLAELKAYKDILAPAGQNAQTASLDGLKTMLELARSMNEDRIDDPDSAPYKLLGKGIDVFQKLIDKANQPLADGAPAAPAQLAAPKKANGGEAPAAPASNQEEEMLKILFQAQLATFIEAAKEADNDYEFYAMLLYKRAPDELLDALKSESWFAQLCTMAPEFAAYQAWAGEVRTLVLAMMKEDEEETLTVTAGAPKVPGDGTAKE
jgi:hypothetical protein